MYKIFSVVFIVISFAAYSQDSDDITTPYRPGVLWFYSGLRPAEPEKPSKYDRLIFDLTYNDWVGDQGPFQNHWASIGLNTNLLFDIPLTKNNTVSFGAGIAHQYTPVRHNRLMVFNDSIGTSVLVEKDSLDLFSASSFSGNSLAIPLEIRFRGKKWKHVKFHLGGKIGYQFKWTSKYRFNNDGVKEVYKRVGTPDAERLIYSAHFRFGIRNWALFGSYNFNSVFKNAESTSLNLLQMGLSISLF